MKIVFLERNSLGLDLDLQRFEALGEVVYYAQTADDQVPERVKDADVVIANKVPMNAQTLGQAERVKLVCLTATGTDNLDKPYLEKAGIAWRNAAGYSTEPVAQHTFALYFYLAEKLAYFDHFVKSGEYSKSETFTGFGRVFEELWGKTWGIIGMGTIGRRVAEIATAFGARVIYYSTTGNNRSAGYPCVDLDALLSESDVVSVHAPLNATTEGMMNREAFQKMKSGAYFINVGRGKIVVDADLADALECGEIRGAALDVLSKEPMAKENPLLRIQDSDKLLITPHVGWASIEARTRLIGIVEQHIKDFMET